MHTYIFHIIGITIKQVNDDQLLEEVQEPSVAEGGISGPFFEWRS